MRSLLVKNILGLAIAGTLTSCEYSDRYFGTFHQVPATMTAYSRNLSRYCISLTLTAGAETKQMFISASDVADENHPLAAKNFNTKTAPCAANLPEYMDGVRTVQVKSTTSVSAEERIGNFLCQRTNYTQYFYQESLSFDLKRKSDDQSEGNFVGTTDVGSFVDMDHPLPPGAIFSCPQSYHPNPYPIPAANPYPQHP